MSRLARTLRHALRDAVVALRVAPVEVALGVAMAVTWSVALAHGHADMQVWLELAFVCMLTGGIAWIATLLHGLGALSTPRRWLLTLAGFAAVVVYDLTLLDLDRAAEGWRAVLLLAAVVSAVTLAPAAVRPPDGNRDRRFREVNLRMLTRLIGVALYAGALYLGLVLAISAVNSLFELHLSEKIYGHVFGAIAFALAPWIFVGGAPAITAPPGPPAESMRIVRRFGVYLFVPLLVVYYLILYAYLVRIALTGELPRNLVSPMVLAAGLIGAVGVMMFAGEEKPLVPWAIRLAAPFFLPLVALGIWAIAVRVAQYGWTEFRYLRNGILVALLALAALGTWALIRRRGLRAYPVSLALGVVALLCALGPWSASAVARHSQQARLAEALRAADVDTASAPAAARVIPADQYDAIRSASRYLAEHFGDEAVAAVAGHAVVARMTQAGSFRDLATALNLNPPVGAREATARLDGGVPVAALGDGELYVVEVPSRSGPEPGRWEKGRTVYRVDVRGRLLSVDLAGLAAQVLEAESVPTMRPPQRAPGARPGPIRLRLQDATLPLRDANGHDVGRFLVRRLVVAGDTAGIRVHSLDGLAVVSPGVSP